MPPEVRSLREAQRESGMEHSAERVIRHRKDLELTDARRAGIVLDSPMLTEIFRLNIAHWLLHADDPRRRIVFADPIDASVCSANAPRVYNINVVYRLTGAEQNGAWHRIRLVVSRKGIVRIEPIA